MPRLLLVEGNEMSRDMLSRRLARRGYDIVVAEDGRRGAETAATDRPDLTLMDMSLPVRDGCAATRALEADPATSDMPVVALTEHASAKDLRRATEAGCDAFVMKPVELDALVAMIEGLLTRGEST